jgi:single-stranded-DNA-specific exonuclease
MLAHELDALNAARKDVEAAVLEEAVAVIERQTNIGPEAVVVVAGEGWHPGVIGIVAGRLRERYRKPVVVIGVDPATGIGKGSGRSQPGANLGRAVQAAFEAGLLMAGGGHAMAAGLTMRADAVPELRDFLCRALAEEGAEATLMDVVDVDALITAGGATRALLEDFQRLQPFGPGNPEPLFAIADARVDQINPLRGGHIRCLLRDPDGGRLRAVAWRAAETPLGRRLLAGGSLHVAGRLKADDWNGRQGVELEIEDAADPRMCG